MQTEHYMANMDKPGRAERLGLERDDVAAADRAPGRTTQAGAAASKVPSHDPTPSGPLTRTS